MSENPPSFALEAGVFDAILAAEAFPWDFRPLLLLEISAAAKTNPESVHALNTAHRYQSASCTYLPKEAYRKRLLLLACKGLVH